MQLTEIFGSTLDLVHLPDWKSDPAWRAAKADEDEAARVCADHKQLADRLWRDAHAGSEVTRLPSPGHSC